MQTNFQTLWKIIDDPTLDYEQTLENLSIALSDMQEELKEGMKDRYAKWGSLENLIKEIVGE